jgi:ABC-type polysaccharide/polyol phosphate export permease
MLAAMPCLLQVGLFLAPVGYPLGKLGPTVRQLVELNPLTGAIEACRWMVVSDYPLSGRVIAYSLVASVAILVYGWRPFSPFETTMGDEI